MAKVLTIALVAAVLGWLLQLILPWWSLAVAAFAACFLLARKGGQALWGSLVGGLLLWTLLSAIIELGSNSILTNKVAEIFFVQQPALLILVTGLIGGLAAMLAGLSGFYFRTLVVKEKKRPSKYTI